MDVRIPNLGESADSGTVATIFVKVGDMIQKGDPILELESEKAVASIPSSAAGTVAAIRVKQGETVKVGQVVLSLVGTETPATAPAVAPLPVKIEQAEEASTEETEQPPLAGSDAAPAAAPSVRRVARELGIELGRVRGTERGGRISMADLRAYVQRLERMAGQGKPEPVPAEGAAETIDFSKWGNISRKPMSTLRRTIARRMRESWNTIPHVTQFDEADLTVVGAFRKKYSGAYEAKGARLTFTPILLKALVETLQQHPIFNASLDENTHEVVVKEYYHIGIAVDTEQGLIVPVLRDANKKTVLELARELEDLAEKTRQRKVTAEDMTGGTFTVSNQGGIGSGHFTPIINKPNVSILGLGRGAMKPVVRNDKIEPRLMVPLCLSYDHRVVDGADAARFMVDLVQAIEEFGEEHLKL